MSPFRAMKTGGFLAKGMIKAAAASSTSKKPWRYEFLRQANPDQVKNFELIMGLEFAPTEDIETYQSERLGSLINHAKEQVPYYKEVLAGITAENLRNAPILTKDIIRTRFEDLKSSDLESRAWYRNSSGGSTGKPITVIQDREYANWSASNMYFFSMGQKMYGESQINLWGSERDLLKGSIGVRAHIDNFLANRRLLNAFYVSDDIWREYTKTWNRVKPVGVWAYVDSAYEMAKFIKKTGIRIHAPKVIVVTAGTMHDFQYDLIHEVFNCPVINQYGSREVGDIAASCPKNEGLHIFEYSHIVEILDANLEPVAAGEQGDVYVTSLISYAMPIIRYRIGDTAVQSDKRCSCGRGFKLIGHITGRSSDHFKALNGSRIHGEYFTHVFYFQDWGETFQVIQEKEDLIQIFIVKARDPKQDQLDKIAEEVRAVMGEECKIRMTFVEQIPRSPSGKFRYTISKVS